ANGSPPAVGGTFTPEWSVIASYQHQFAPNFKGSIGGQYSIDYYATPLAGTLPIGNVQNNLDSWAVEGVLVWNPVENLEVRGEVRYTEFEGNGGDATTGLFRLQRNF
ncbi:porin, partial [Hoeflea poritis]